MRITGASAVEDLLTPTSFLLIGGETIGLDGGFGPGSHLCFAVEIDNRL